MSTPEGPGTGCPKLVIFGAGNIGRSFVGQLFARSGWEVVFADVDVRLVAQLNERRGYSVVVKREGKSDEEIPVRGVRAVDARDRVAITAEIASADCLATSVGKNALPGLLPVIAEGLMLRERQGRGTLDVILAENDREAPETVRNGLRRLLPEGFPLEHRLGIVETSIGKMVPIMRAEDLDADRLKVYAEAYNELILDAKGFLGPVPSVTGLVPVEEIEAFVDTKLFVHNLGHATVAYLAFCTDPACRTISAALDLPGVASAASRAMTQSAAALVKAYPGSLSQEYLDHHIQDLLSRFGNSALGDTIHRVGRDLPRKLYRADRIVGAALLCDRFALPWDGALSTFNAALGFASPDENGKIFPADQSFHDLYSRKGLQAVLREVSCLDPENPQDQGVWLGLAKECAD